MTKHQRKPAKYYSPAEERLNIVSHAIGIVYGLIALPMLILRALQYGDIWHLIGFTVFGLSIIILFSASTLYHSTQAPDRRSFMRVIDHSAIYISIAGSYTPFTLVTLHGGVGWLLFGLTWTMAAIGITLKIFFTGRYSLVSTLMYVFMGWLIVFAIKPLIANLATAGLYWLVAGGLAYTIGAVLYSIKKIPFNHAIFHCFVLVGSVCQCIAVYGYV